MRKFKIRKAKVITFEFSNYLNDPIVGLSFLVLALVALLLSVINFLQAVYPV